MAEAMPLIQKDQDGSGPGKRSNNGGDEEMEEGPSNAIEAVEQVKPMVMEGLFKDRKHYPSTRAYVHDLVEGEFDSWVEYSIFALILLNVFAFMLGTLIIKGEAPCHGKCVTVNDKYDIFFEVFEAFSVLVFTVEYILRLWSCVEEKSIAERGPFWGRVAYATSFYPIIDFISISPWYLTLLNLVEDFDFSTSLRIFRLVRLLKAEKYINAFALLGHVLAENGSLLIVTLYYSLITWFICSTLLYFTERNNPELAQAFSSIPNAMFPTLVMLTGEYPYADFTTAGKYIAGIIAVIAVAIFAVPTAVIGSGFVKAVQESKGLNFTVDAE